MPPSSEPPQETEPQLGQVRKRLEFPTSDRKRPRTRSGGPLRVCEQEAGRTNRRGDANTRGSPAKKDGGSPEEEDCKPTLVTSSDARISSDIAQEVVQEVATPDAYLPPGWMFQKVEPDW